MRPLFERVAELMGKRQVRRAKAARHGAVRSGAIRKNRGAETAPKGAMRSIFYWRSVGGRGGKATQSSTDTRVRTAGSEAVLTAGAGAGAADEMGGARGEEALEEPTGTRGEAA